MSEEKVVLNRLKDEMKAKLVIANNDPQAARRLSATNEIFLNNNSPNLAMQKSKNTNMENDN